MPCFTVQEVSIALDVADFGLLVKAMQEIGMTDMEIRLDRKVVSGRLASCGYVTYEFGALKGRDLNDTIVNNVKVAYAKQVVQAAARRNGWKLNFTKSRPGQNQQLKLSKGGW